MYIEYMQVERCSMLTYVNRKYITYGEMRIERFSYTLLYWRLHSKSPSLTVDVSDSVIADLVLAITWSAAIFIERE